MLFAFFVLVKSHTFVFILAVLIYLNSANVKFERTIDLIWKVYLVLIILSFVLYFMDISDGGISRSYSNVRQAPAYGFTHANSGGFFFLNMFLAKIVADISITKERMVTSKTIIVDIVMGLICFYMIYFVFKCRTGAVVFLLTIMLIWIFRKIKYKKIFKYILFALHPILLSLTYLFAKWYPNPITDFLNIIFSSRLFLLHYHIMNNSITLFGNSVDYGRYTLDSSYMTMLLQYGLIPSFLFVIGSILVFNKAWRKKDGYIIVATIAFLIYGFTENGIFDIFINFTYLYLLVGNKSLKLNRIKEKLILNSNSELHDWKENI